MMDEQKLKGKGTQTHGDEKMANTPYEEVSEKAIMKCFHRRQLKSSYFPPVMEMINIAAMWMILRWIPVIWLTLMLYTWINPVTTTMI